MATPAGGAARKTGKKNRKWNNNKVYCAKYRALGLRRKNKLRKLARHLKKLPNDGTAKAAFKRIDKDIMWGIRS